MQMKEAIRRMEAGRVPPVVFDRRPKVFDVAESIAPNPTDVVIPQPPDLDAISARIAEAFAQGSVPDRSDLHHAPWCLWNGARPLADDEGILESYLRHVIETSRKSAFSRLASAYVIDFPVGSPSLQIVAATLKKLAPRFVGPWSTASESVDIFDPKVGPDRIAQVALTETSSPTKTLAKFGIANLASESGLAEAAFLAGLQRIRINGSLSAIARLDAIMSWGLRPDGTMLFHQHRGTLVDALVLPHANERPEEDVRGRYLKFLVGRFDDPRLSPNRWVQMKCTPTVRQWLTEQTLRQFLNVVGKVAYDFQYRYRRAFWEAAYAKGIIQEAWVIFDGEGEAEARKIFETETPFARWAKKPGIKGHSCLLLRVGRGVIAEWSHQGQCHIWHDADDPTAPRLNLPVYKASSVKCQRGSEERHARVSITHNNSDLYYWQSSVAAEISKLTGHRLLESDYRV